MGKKICVGILFGGKSPEHEISILSAKSIVKAINKKKYEIVLIWVNKKGEWCLSKSMGKPSDLVTPVSLIPGKESGQLVSLLDQRPLKQLDVVFPVFHGLFGEDGTIQGLLKLVNLPFVGASVLGSAVGLDKDVTKRLLRDAGIPIAKFLVFQSKKINFNSVKDCLGLPFFVKPANAGSSVGINKISNKKEFNYAVKDAFKYDSKILIEEYIEGKEVECSVLGNEKPIASLPGKIVPQHEFYSYEAKYLDDKGAILEIPAKLPKNITSKVQELAVKAFKVLCCEGMARVDFFLKSNNEVIVNEINTIPGFTNISMYPKLWEASGLPYTELVDRLIQLALERHKKETKIITSFIRK